MMCDLCVMWCVCMMCDLCVMCDMHGVYVCDVACVCVQVHVQVHFP